MHVSKAAESLFKSIYNNIGSQEGDLRTGLTTQISNLRKYIDKLSQLPKAIRDRYRISDDKTYYRLSINIKSVYIRTDGEDKKIYSFEDWIKKILKKE